VFRQQPLRFGFRAYRRPFARSVLTAQGEWTAREGIVVRLESPDGQVAFGEISPLPSFGTETLLSALAYCASLPEELPPTYPIDPPDTLPCCRFAFAVALACFEGSPLAAARRKPVLLSALLPAGPAALDRLPRLAAAGWRCFKWKVGAFPLGRELEILARLADLMPAGAKLRLDANRGLKTTTALQMLEAAAEAPVEFLEEPLSSAEPSDLLALAADSPVPLALDESVTGVDAIKRWRDLGWRGLFVAKPAVFGSPEALLAEVAQGPSDFVFSSALETGIGLAAGLRLAFASSPEPRALGYGVADFFRHDGMSGGLQLGPTIDPSALLSVDEAAIWNLLE
jgi:o-succinylbenzoate synthase